MAARVENTRQLGSDKVRAGCHTENTSAGWSWLQLPHKHALRTGGAVNISGSRISKLSWLRVILSELQSVRIKNIFKPDLR